MAVIRKCDDGTFLPEAVEDLPPSKFEQMMRELKSLHEDGVSIYNGRLIREQAGQGSLLALFLSPSPYQRRWMPVVFAYNTWLERKRTYSFS